MHKVMQRKILEGRSYLAGKEHMEALEEMVKLDQEAQQERAKIDSIKQEQPDVINELKEITDKLDLSASEENVQLEDEATVNIDKSDQQEIDIFPETYEPEQELDGAASDTVYVATWYYWPNSRFQAARE